MEERSSEFGGITEDHVQIKDNSTELKATDKQSKAMNGGLQLFDDQTRRSRHDISYQQKICHYLFGRKYTFHVDHSTLL